MRFQFKEGFEIVGLGVLGGLENLWGFGSGGVSAELSGWRELNRGRDAQQ